MNLLLVIDIGNTHTAFGTWDGQRLLHKWRIATRRDHTGDEVGALLASLLMMAGISAADIEGAVVASVAPPVEGSWDEAIKRYIGKDTLLVGRDMVPSMPIRYQRPHELGADRLVNAYAGHKLYGGPLIVVDYGTATTFDCVSAQGAYLGGAIAPGMELGAEALSRNTAKLPRIDATSLPDCAIAQDTENAIKNGLLWGQVGLTREMVARIRRELESPPRVVATGGLAEVIAPHCEIIEEIVPDLTLMGLAWLGQENSV